MKKKFFSVFFAVVLVLSFSLVTAVPAAATTFTRAGSSIDVLSQHLCELGAETEVAFNAEPETLVLDGVAFDAQTCSQVTIEGEVSDLTLGAGWVDTAYIEIGLRPEATMNARNAGVYLIALNAPAETQIHLQDYTGGGRSGGVIKITKDADFRYKITLETSGSTGGTATLEVWVGDVSQGTATLAYGYASTWEENVAGALNEDFSNAHLFYSIIADRRGAADQTYSATVGDITIDDTLYVGTGKQFPTIQAAINFANPGDTIDVATGTYNEDVTVNMNLTLNGAQVDTDPRGGRAGDESEIVGVVEVTSAATNVVFDGFKFTSPTRAFTPRGFNLRIESASSTVTNNIFIAEENAGHTYSGYLDFEGITNATVTQNSFSGHLDLTQELNVIRLGIAGAGIVTVADNEMRDVGGGGGIGIMCGNDGAVVSIDGNEIENTGNECIWVWNPGSSAFATLSITSNDLSEATLNGIKFVAPITGVVSVSDDNEFWDNPVQVLDSAEILDIQGVLDTNIFDRAVVVDHASLLHTIWSSIQDGIGAAVTGDTVIVAAGLYNERLTINTSLDLRGARYGVDPTPGGARTTPADESIIDITGLSPLDPNVAVEIASGVSNVSVAGFTLTGSPTSNYADEAIVRCWNDGIAIEDNIMDGFVGVLYKGSGTGLTVHRNRMVVNKNGVVIQVGASDATISNNVITLGSTPAGDESAIYMTGCSESSVTGNTATGFIHNAALAGSNLDHLTVSGNTFTGNAAGISIWGNSTFITVNNNNVLSDSLATDWSDSGCGISIKGQDIVITGNQITNNADIGVKIDYHVIPTERVTISNNNIADNTNYGVWVNTTLVTETVNATNNWWGTVNGPTHAGNTFNVDDQGDAVSDLVDFVPWLDAAYDIGDSFAPVENIDAVEQFSSIQAAIDVADPSDHVNVKAGTYQENVTINTIGVILHAVTKHEAVIKGTVVITADSVIVDGFSIKDFSQIPTTDWSGVYIPSGTDVKVVNNLIDGTGIDPVANLTVGIHTLYGATAEATLKGNIIRNVRMGIYNQGASLLIIGNTIENASHCGIGIDTDLGTDIHGNTISNSGDMGIEVFQENVVAMINNITGNAVGVWSSGPQVDATYNWWGSVNGPGQDGANDVLGDVDYSPWLPGEWETYYDFEAEELIDSDGDGFSDLEEYWLGTDPNDPESLPGATIDPDEVDNAYVEGDDPGEVNLEDSEGDPIADVDISGGGDASGTITGARYTKEPEEETGLSIGTGTTGVAFLDIKVTGYTEGIARITVPYPDVAPDDGIVDGTSIDETTLSLYYWDEATSTWLIADNNVVDTVNNNVSGDIPVSALAGTPVGMGGYLEDEAAVAIESILNLSYSGEDTVYLTIDTNTAFLGAATIDLTFDPRVVEVIAGENSAFDTLTVNLNYAVIGNDTQIARFVAHQEGEAGVDATGGVVVAVVKLNAVGSTMDESPLTIEVITLKDNKGDTIPVTLGDNDSIAIVGGIGDANRDGVVDAYDCVYIARAIAGFQGYSIDVAVMDVSGDTILDVWDCTHLARHLVGIAGYEQLGG